MGINIDEPPPPLSPVRTFQNTTALLMAKNKNQSMNSLQDGVNTPRLLLYTG